MTSPAVLPGPAERPSRTAAGRRALQLALLAGGLLALGLLCGGRAQAAEGTAAVPSTPTLTSLVSRPGVDRVLPAGETAPDEKATPAGTTDHQPTPHQHAARTTAQPTATPEPSSAATAPVTRPAPPAPAPPTTPAAPVVRVVPVVGETVRSVTDTVTATVTTVVTQGLGEVVRQVSELPVQLPSLPGWLPTLPEPPGGSPVLPVPVPPVGSVPAPVTPAPVTPAPGTTKARPAVTEGGGQQSTPAGKPAATALPYGPRGPACAPASTPFSGTAAHQHPGGHRAVRAFAGPSHPAPTGDPDGALGKSAVDGGSSRHGDAYAVTFADRAPLRLVPGAAAHDDAAGTRDRYRDIPVFPG